MWDRFRLAAVMALLAGVPLIAQAQPGRGALAVPETGTTVFHGTASELAGEVPGYGGNRTTSYTTSGGGTTVYHGAPGGTAGPSPVPPPPWAFPPQPPSNAGR